LSRSARALATLVAASLVVLASAAVLMTRVEHVDSNEEVAAKAAAWAKEHPALSFRGVFRFSDADLFSYRVRAEGGVDGDDYRMVLSEGGTHHEVVAHDGELFLRSALTRDRLKRSKWGRIDAPGPEGPGNLLSPYPLEPSSIGELIRGVGSVDGPVERDDDGLRRVRGLAGDDYVGESDDLEQVDVDLRVTGSGRPARILLVMNGAPGRATADIRITSWTSPPIAPPSAADIDPTPETDEEGLAAYSATALFQPVRLPEGWVRAGAVVLDPSEVGDCPTVNVFYTEPSDPEGSYLDLYQSPLACSDVSVAAGARRIEAGPASGFFDRDQGDGVVTGHIVLGSTVVFFETDMNEQRTLDVLRELRPFDLNVNPEVLPSAA
jgi:hypothetical protein